MRKPADETGLLHCNVTYKNEIKLNEFASDKREKTLSLNFIQRKIIHLYNNRKSNWEKNS
jgi:hypothetical protein